VPPGRTAGRRSAGSRWRRRERPREDGRSIADRRIGPDPWRTTVLTLGVLLLILAVLFEINVLWTIGIILTVIGLILALLGVLDRSVGPRRYYY
jgi:protein-S-isoprenylcysteine O-methyltransferase Ste14